MGTNTILHILSRKKRKEGRVEKNGTHLREGNKGRDEGSTILMQNYCHDKVEVEVMIEGEIKREVELGSGSGKSLHISRIIFIPATDSFRFAKS